MPEVLLLAVPLAALAYLTAVGAGLAASLAPRFQHDAQAALAPLCGAALLASVSVLVPLGVSARAVAVAVTVLGAGVTVAFRSRVARVLRAAAVPAGVAVAAITLASVPALGRGDWHAASLYGSTDAYHWSSQARSYLDGPPAPPASEHPDRVTYERSQAQHWAVALPFGLFLLAWLSGSDPASAYGALAAVVFALLPLAGFAVARACLDWRGRLAAFAGLALALNASLLFASHFSWQQQLAGTAFAFAAAAALFLALERGARRREIVLAALLAAAALATYRMGFAPYLAAVLACAVAARAASARASPSELRRLGATVGLFTLALAGLAAPSLVALARGLPDFYSSGGFSTAFKRAFPDGQPADALGLVPWVWDAKGAGDSAAIVVWLVVATAVGGALLVLGYRTLHRSERPRAAFVAVGGALTLAGYCVLLLPVFSSYLSFKVLAYGAPFLVLLAVTPIVLAHGPTRVFAAAALAALMAPAAAVGTAAAVADSNVPQARATLAAAAARLPENAVVAIAVDDPWEQAWALYYLRERRLSVERPSYLLTAQGRSRPAAAYRHRPVAYSLGVRTGRRVLWRSGELRLVRL